MAKGRKARNKTSARSKTASRKKSQKKGSRKIASRTRKKIRKKAGRRRAPSAPAPEAEMSASLRALHSALAPSVVTDEQKKKRKAVVDCVNRFMDEKREGWNHDKRGNSRKLGADYRYPPLSIPALL